MKAVARREAKMVINQNPATGSSSDTLLRMVYASLALGAASSSVISVSLPFRFLALGLPVDNYGIVVGGYALGMLLLEAFWGRLAFRLAVRRWIVVLGGVVVALVLVLGFLPTFLPLLLDYTALGAIFIFLIPLQRFVGMHAQGPSSEGRGVGRTSAFWGVGFALGSAAGPVIFTTFGFRADVTVSAMLFGGSIVTSAIAPWRSARLPALATNAPSGLRTMSLSLARVSLLVVAAFIIFSFPSSYLPYYAVVFYGISRPGTGYILGAARLVSLLASFFLGSWGDRRGHPQAVLISFFLLAAGIAGTWFAPNAVGMTAATLLMFVGWGWLGASLLPLAMAPIATRQRGSAIGLYGSMEDLGLLLGPVIFGFVWSYWGGVNLFPVALAVAIMGFVLTLPFVFRWPEARVR